MADSSSYFQRISRRLQDDGESTITSEEQEAVEKTIISRMHRASAVGMDRVRLWRDKHIQFLKRGLVRLSSDYECLDASRPWLCYWIVHSLSLLDYTLLPAEAHNVVEFLQRCQCREGGFGGGPGQLPHLATTYAAVLALCEIGTKEAYDVIDRPALQRFILSMCQPDGSLIMHRDGEVDMRGVYCAAVPAFLTNIVTPQMFSKTGDWIASCQTYEGGFAAVPGAEAHGGYAFCALAAAILLNKESLVDCDALLQWASRRQMKLEGGFQGRTNKLVDSCYSFWVGGIFPLLYFHFQKCGVKSLAEDNWHFDQSALQEYVLCCCQHPFGGLVDKPGKSQDFYHTCYSLSGISTAQNCPKGCISCVDDESLLLATHPVYNIVMEKVDAALKYFTSVPAPKIQSVDTS